MALKVNLNHFLSVLDQDPRFLYIELDHSVYINHHVEHGTGETKNVCKEPIRRLLALRQLENA